MATSIFEYATRNKLRFESAKGSLTVEQLWDVPLRSKDGFDLDAVAKTVHRALKGVTEESFVETERTPLQDRLEIALAVVKAVIGAKILDEEAAKRRAANKLEKEHLLRALAEKQEGKLSAMSEAELKRRISALEE